MISVDTDVLKQLAQASQNANQELEAASQLLNQVTAHNDWGCKERVTINNYIQNSRTKMQALMESSRSFSSVMTQVMEEFVKTESGISDMFETVESWISKIISITVPAGGVSTTPSITDILGPLKNVDKIVNGTSGSLPGIGPAVPIMGDPNIIGTGWSNTGRTHNGTNYGPNIAIFSSILEGIEQ